jgi:hypothetical protein
MLSVDKHCEMLTDQIRDRNKHIMNAFKLYVQMFSAIVGGSVALRLQSAGKVPVSFSWLVDALALLVFLITAVIISDNVRGWHEYRQRLSEIAGRDRNHNPIVPLPTLWKSKRVEVGMIGVMAISLVAFWLFNHCGFSN